MELTRIDIAKRLPDNVNFSLRKVSFSGFGYGDASSLIIKRNGEEMPSMFFGEEQLNEWRDVIDAYNKIKGNTYKGRVII